MSISGISSASSTDYTNPFLKIKEDFQDIGAALKSGNVSDAQKAFATLQTDSSSQAGDANNPMSTDIQSLGNSIQSGDVAGAEQTLEQIQKHMKGHGDFAKQQIDLQSSTSNAASASQTGTTGSSTDPIQQAFQSLSAALSSGNLSDAQSAFATLQNDLTAQSSSSTTTATESASTASASATASGSDPLQQDFQNLSSALTAGNLSDAQSAFATLQNDLTAQSSSSSPSTTTATDSASTASASATASNSDPLRQDFQSLSSALSSGNLADAQTAFAALQNDLATQSSGANGSLHHHHGSFASTSTAAADSASSAGSSSLSLGSTLNAAVSSYLQSSSTGYSQAGTNGSLLSSAAFL